MSVQPIKRALLSVSDKTGIEVFARALADAGVEILSTGGTARLLADANIPVTPVEDVTDFPEIMGGRVKTLHPKIHGGILGRRDIDAQAIEYHHIPLIDLVVVNLYPFAQTIAKPDCRFADAVENIDIGGPAMIRSAAKNHDWVSVVTDPSDYAMCLEAVSGHGGLSLEQRQALALKAFTHTANYDATISAYLKEQLSAEPYPDTLTVTWEKQQSLRYGENPHQSAAFYRQPGATEGFAGAVTHQGKALSYNNLADADAALTTVSAFTAPACVIVKHANPCGVAVASSCKEAYERAFACDTVSAFGGIIAFNEPVDKELVECILSNQFVEVILAPSFDSGALAAAKRKPNVRLISLAQFPSHQGMELKRISGGLLVQAIDAPCTAFAQAKVVTQRSPSAAARKDLAFAWTVCQYVKSNAIVFAKGEQTIGVGAGQMSRVVSTQIAKQKAIDGGFSPKGAVMASDAFFPFTDSIEQAAEAGIEAIVQPGGSIKDQQVIDAANEHGIAMVFTGVRHFKH